MMTRETTGPPEIVRGISGEAVAILKKPDEALLKKQLYALYHEHGYRSLAVVLMHSYTYPAHEQLIKRIALDIGFHTVSCSSQLMPMIKMVPRATSSTADAYLTPVCKPTSTASFPASKTRYAPVKLEQRSNS